MEETPATGKIPAPDGTQLAYWTAGTGAALVLVHGTTSDHATFNELVPLLTGRRTVITFDRRGRGQSGDGAASYDIEREFDDVAAIIDHFASAQAAPVDVFSHSFGAFVALGAAARTANARAVVAYSPGFGDYPPGSLDQIEAATASGNPDEVLQVMFRDVIGMPDQEIQAMRQSPVWKVREAAAGTISRECRADESFLSRYHDMLQALNCPVMVLSGATNSAPKRELAVRLASLLPAPAFKEMPAQGHVAHHFAPAELSDICLSFYDAHHAGSPASTTG